MPLVRYIRLFTKLHRNAHNRQRRLCQLCHSQSPGVEYDYECCVRVQHFKLIIANWKQSLSCQS